MVIFNGLRGYMCGLWFLVFSGIMVVFKGLKGYMHIVVYGF